MVAPRHKRPMVQHLQQAYRLSGRRACQVLCLHRSTYNYRSVADPHNELRMRIRDLATTRLGWGYRRLTVLLQREGWPVGPKLIYRLYREENLLLRPKSPRRRVSRRAPPQVPELTGINQRWSMDFMADQLADGRRFRLFTLVDDFSRESLYIGVGFRFTGEQVAEILTALKPRRGLPATIRVDNGTEFTSVALDQWVYWNQVQLAFSRPGTPTDNPLIEAFNGRLRQECLNAHWFTNLADAKQRVRAWQAAYNEEHPHSGLGGLTPNAFAQTHQKGVPK